MILCLREQREKVRCWLVVQDVKFPPLHSRVNAFLKGGKEEDHCDTKEMELMPLWKRDIN